MYKSREVRWFFKDENEVMAKWFQSHQLDFNRVEPRTDYYHLPTLSEALGIKIREGRLEFKHRISGPYTGILHNDQQINYEDWTKWSFELSDKDPVTKTIAEDNKNHNWLAVNKTRMAVNVGEAQNSELRIFGLDIIIPRGCQLEYTKLEVGGELWYSFGLEWFGEPWMDLSLKFLKEILGNIELSEQTTRSYPSFLLDQTPNRG